jgi:hypothetical protein
MLGLISIWLPLPRSPPIRTLCATSQLLHCHSCIVYDRLYLIESQFTLCPFHVLILRKPEPITMSVLVNISESPHCKLIVRQGQPI